MIRAALIGVVLALIVSVAREPNVDHMTPIVVIFLLGGVGGILLVVDLLGGKK